MLESMLKGKMALFLRILLFSVAGIVAALPFAGFDADTGILTIDLSGASAWAVTAIWSVIGGGTFAWSRMAKVVGGIT